MTMMAGKSQEESAAVNRAGGEKRLKTTSFGNHPVDSALMRTLMNVERSSVHLTHLTYNIASSLGLTAEPHHQPCCRCEARDPLNFSHVFGVRMPFS